MNTKPATNIAIFFFDIFDISGGGGAERFYADFYNDYQTYNKKKFGLYLLTNNNYDNLVTAGRNINKYPENILNVDTGTENVASTKFGYLKHILKSLLICLRISKTCRQNGISIIQIPIYREYYFFIFYFLKKITPIKIIINLTDCRLPYYYNSNDESDHFASRRNFNNLFNRIKINGIVTWYTNVKLFCEQLPSLEFTPIKVISHRYLSHNSMQKIQTNFKKEKLIIFAGRLDKQKDPMIFIEAVNVIAKVLLDLDYKVEIYGKGPLQKDVADYIIDKNLVNLVFLKESAQMLDVFSKSEIFVSAQQFDNYPSLSIFEAMYCENMIIAFDEGDTKNLIQDNYNGFLIKTRDKNLLAKRIIDVININNKKEVIEHIRKTLSSEHTFENFVNDMELFWNKMEYKN